MQMLNIIFSMSVLVHINDRVFHHLEHIQSVAKLSIRSHATGHAMQIYNCLGQLRQF